MELENEWWSSQYGPRTKLTIYHSCVLSGSEFWLMTENDQRKLSTFHNKSLRKIWPQTSSKDLLRQCIECTGIIIRQGRWRWIGHVIRRQTQFRREHSAGHRRVGASGADKKFMIKRCRDREEGLGQKLAGERRQLINYVLWRFKRLPDSCLREWIFCRNIFRCMTSWD